MYCKAVLFDVGGTLDSDGITWIDRFVPLYREAGVDVPDEPLRRAFYDSDDNLSSRFDLSKKGFEETVRLQVGCVVETLKLDPALTGRVSGAFVEDSRRAFARNRPLLERLRERYRLGVVSNFYSNLETVLESEDMARFFDVIAVSEKVGAMKPDKKIFLHATRALGVEPSEAIMVGDSVPRDMRGAEALDMPHAWLAGGRAPSGACCGRAAVLRTLPDLEPLLLGPSGTHAGIIAAGEGSRMQGEHPGPKPLVPVGGKPLVHWIVSSLREAGVRSIVILLNTSGDAVRAYLEKHFTDIRWTFLREDTPSSWESFRLVSKELARRAESFMISTVDAVLAPSDAAKFAREALSPWRAGETPAAALAVTGFVDDEKPLWADVDAEGRVTALGAGSRRRETATCGLYALRRSTAETLPPAEAHGKLREFWGGLIDAGHPVRGVLLEKTIDVDRPRDVGAAEEMLRETRPGASRSG